MNTRKKASYTLAMKKINWSKIEIDGYEQEDLQECLKSIVSVLRRVRTLDEVLLDYELNYKQIEFSMRKTAPKRPKNASQAYIEKNREHLKQLYLKEHPGKDLKFVSRDTYLLLT
jgi:hypothetical protein